MLKYSLKTKLVLFIALLMIVLLITGSLVLIYQERELIITRHKEISKAIVKSFSPSITDALMYEEIGILPVEGFVDQLANQIQNQKALPIKFIMILSEEFEPIVLRDPLEFGKKYTDYLLTRAIEKKELQSIFLHPKYGWVSDAVEFLEISGKRWGYLIVGFDAEIVRDEINTLFISLVIIATFIIIVTLISVYFITGHLTKNLNKIVSGMDKIDIHTEEIIQVPQSDDEIGFLAMHFNEMQSRLLRSRNELKECTKRNLSCRKTCFYWSLGFRCSS